MGSVNIHVSEKIKMKIFKPAIIKINPDSKLHGNHINKMYRDVEKRSNGYYLMVSDDICISKTLKDSIEIENENLNRNFDVIKKVCETISHEEIHMWIQNNIDNNEMPYITSRLYDNIIFGLRLEGIMA